MTTKGTTKEEAIIRARDVMRTKLVTIDGMATVREAADKMRKEHLSHLLVERRNADDAWAIISIRDLVEGVLLPDRPAEDVNVFEVMTKPVITVPPDMDIRYVARLLHNTGLSRVPVEENGELIGMISLSSLILYESIF
ncbi:MAG: CBS domain-containing protein [Candidatus Electrothrix sp. AW2]|jgi:CBS domain-containing protein|nr:CBS domain-containing protein [Candidatus Electrothrix sp. AX1]MCI5117718.1 CBS domain-containing protein [Candidatus Electrothrix gigas]MCI5128138.1 CBS domain-containing protein [Candidatus Electrothrix gigas]MCI5134088.1 CBS domain-containing protein [Candidatus Electrothrix gigas]MCI5178771.1 CBS domain-containing protein [Candidatus Electrothrix gigas]